LPNNNLDMNMAKTLQNLNFILSVYSLFIIKDVKIDAP